MKGDAIVRRDLVAVGVLAGLLFVAGPAPAGAQDGLTNVALGAKVTLNGAPFFENGWGAGKVVAAETLVDDVFLRRGVQWDQGAVWWDGRDGLQRWITIELDHTCVIESFVVQADDNERYLLFYWDVETEAWQLAWIVPNFNVFGDGMQTRPNPADDSERYVLPEPIVTTAFRFRGMWDDVLFSVSEVQAFGSCLGTVLIDIKPGSDPNSINTDDKGVIPVAILTTEDFDAVTVDEDTVRFGPAEAEKTHKQAHVEDVDDDGDLDLLLHFRTQDTGIAPGDTEACVTGETYDGVPVMGCDAVRTVPPE